MTIDREYFEDDNQSAGYRVEGYHDFASNLLSAERIKSFNPKSAVDIGGSRGYVAKKLVADGIPTTVIDISDHCYHTRAVESFVVHNLLDIPYPFSDNQFDLVYSISTLEHLPYDRSTRQ